MKRNIITIVSLLLVLNALMAGTWWWQTGRVQERIATLLPPLPALDAAPAALREQLTAAEAEARSHTHAQRGFARLARLYHANGFLDEAARCYAGLRQIEAAEPRWSHLPAAIRW